MYKRLLEISLSSKESCFLWGPRQTGKSTLLRTLFPETKTYDLLLSSEYRRLLSNPSLIREELDALGLTGENQQYPVIIDEVQKVPDILDEIHWLIENRGIRFILCGSSPRKLKRSHANLLGGRAVLYELFPLVSSEINNFSLHSALNRGLIPRHYLSETPKELLQSYIASYLREEIAEEAMIRKIPSFNRFLEMASLSNGEIINYNNIARECGISAPTVKEYYQILEDTLIGKFLPSFMKRAKRRVIHAPKFYFYDVGIVSELARRGDVVEGSELFGRAFEHFIYMELKAHSSYSAEKYGIHYWRTASMFEVDFILGDGEIVVEIKSSASANDSHMKGLRAYKEEHSAKKYILVSRDPNPRKTSDGIDILPWKIFLERLWSGDIL